VLVAESIRRARRAISLTADQDDPVLGTATGALERFDVGDIMSVPAALAGRHVGRALQVARLEALRVAHVDQDDVPALDLLLRRGRQELLDPALDQLERGRHVLAGHLHGAHFLKYPKS
jgi:hypothetical protein